MDFPARIEHAAEADGGEDEGEIESRPEHRRPQVTGLHGDALSWPERHVLKGAGVLVQGDLVLGAAVDVVEDDRRQAAARQLTQVGDVDDTGEADGTAQARIGAHSGRTVADSPAVPAALAVDARASSNRGGRASTLNCRAAARQGCFA
jgi:hypothetical protein